MTLIGMINDHTTPKINMGGIAYTMESRDYKGVMVVVISKEDRFFDGEDVRRVLRSRCIHGYVHNR